jgi:hypothetical protein
LGAYFVGRCSGSQYRPWHFNGRKYPGGEDFKWYKLYNLATGEPRATPAHKPYSVPDAQLINPGTPSPILAWLWGKALGEWM